MRSRTPIRRWATRGSAAAFTAVALVAGMQMAVTGGAQAAVHHAPAVVNPYSPAYHHAYRHGVVPTIPRQKQDGRWDRSHPRNASANDLNYGGGIDGIGVTTGPEKVYLVFYGSQWGTQGTNGNGDITLSGDPSGQAPYLQELFKGLGTGGELWSGVMTQYCDGVAVGAQTCPASNTQHVAYPTGGALAGVWVDESTASPSRPPATSSAWRRSTRPRTSATPPPRSNRDAQYVIISPHGTNPDNYKTQGVLRLARLQRRHHPERRRGDLAVRRHRVHQHALHHGLGRLLRRRTSSTARHPGRRLHRRTATSTPRPSPTRTRPAAGPTPAARRTATSAPGSPRAPRRLVRPDHGHGTFAMQTTWSNDGTSGAGTCEASHPIVTNPAAATPSR